MSTTTGHWKAGGLNFTSNGRTFSVEEQLYINRQACSAWQVGIVFGQVSTIFFMTDIHCYLFSDNFEKSEISNIKNTTKFLGFSYIQH